jgi:hypothetical protein
MPVTLRHRHAGPDVERMVIEGVSWDAYVALNDSIGERKNPRMIYCAGRLTLVTKSRRHAADVIRQMRLADQLGAGAWHKQLPNWVRETILPRRQ